MFILFLYKNFINFHLDNASLNTSFLNFGLSNFSDASLGSLISEKLKTLEF